MDGVIAELIWNNLFKKDPCSQVLYNVKPPIKVNLNSITYLY